VFFFKIFATGLMSEAPKHRRMVIVSSYFPPNISGSSTVLRNLVSQLDPRAISVVTELHRQAPGSAQSTVPKGITIYKAALPDWLLTKIPYIWRWERYFRFALTPVFRNLTLRAIKEAGAECILGIYPNWPCFIGAYQASCTSGIPLYTYHMDIPVRRSAVAPFEGFFIDNFESKILRSSQNRLIVTEGYEPDFSRRHNLDTTFIPHTLELTERRERLAKLPIPDHKPPFRIVHTGIVVGQKEGLLRIAQTLHKNPDLNAKLILSTPTAKADLLKSGFDLPCVEIHSLPQEEVLKLQASAHILTTVFPFYTKTKEGAMAGYPTKLVEYLSLDRPILIHAPEWSFVVKHARKHNYAKVVDRPDPEQLAETIRTLLQNPGNGKTIQANAHAFAENFDIRKVTRKFVDALNLCPSIIKESL
jgi:glycosyltransferase involved in cell wall biosynthesis